MEETVIRNPTDKTLQQIHATKRQLITLRKSVWPLREVIGSLEKSDSVIVADTHATVPARCVRPLHPGNRHG